MRPHSIGVLALMLSASMVWAQNDKPSEQPPPAESKPRPTLGPPTAPSLNGPRSSTTTDIKRLLRVKKVYVQSIDNLLGEKLMEALGKSGRFQIVADLKEADALVRGTCFDSRRLKTLHSEVFITDRVTGASIWQDKILRPFNPPALQKAVDDTAAMVTQHLNDDVQLALRK